MVKINMQEFCSYCDKPLDDLDDKLRRPARFCNPEHRTLFHNKMKAMERVVYRIIQDVKKLADFMDENNGVEFRMESARHLQAIETEVYARVPKIHYKCRNCHQETFNKPEATDICAYCGEVGSFISYLKLKITK